MQALQRAEARARPRTKLEFRSVAPVPAAQVLVECGARSPEAGPQVSVLPLVTEIVTALRRLEGRREAKTGFHPQPPQKK